MYSFYDEKFNQLDKKASSFIYEQIYKILKHKIVIGELRPNDKLPSEYELSKIYRINRNTIRKAIEKLRHEGLIYTVKGKGSFVTVYKIPYKVSSKTRFTETILSLGHKPDAKLIESYDIRADEEISSKLNIEAHSKVIVLEILRYVDTVPFCYSKSFLNANRFSDIKNYIKDNFSLYAILREIYKIEPIRLLSEFEVSLPGNHEIKLLGISNRTPLLTIKSLVADSEEKPIEYCISKFRGDICTISLNFNCKRG